MTALAAARLMIVDDSRIIRRKIARSLEQHELEVIARAANGREAVEMFKTAQPDIVTMDLTMPEMDGIECVELLVELNPNVLILVVSALADKSTAIQALKKGANGFLCKPFTDEQQMALGLPKDSVDTTPVAEKVPEGRLPEGARPTSYRLSLTVIPICRPTFASRSNKTKWPRRSEK